MRLGECFRVSGFLLITIGFTQSLIANAQNQRLLDLRSSAEFSLQKSLTLKEMIYESAPTDGRAHYSYETFYHEPEFVCGRRPDQTYEISYLFQNKKVLSSHLNPNIYIHQGKSIFFRNFSERRPEDLTEFQPEKPYCIVSVAIPCEWSLNVIEKIKGLSYVSLGEEGIPTEIHRVRIPEVRFPEATHLVLNSRPILAVPGMIYDRDSGELLNSGNLEKSFVLVDFTSNPGLRDQGDLRSLRCSSQRNSGNLTLQDVQAITGLKLQ